ncbi:hypothetical protein ABFX02_05G092600 [Erythranthe guttata]
MQNNGFSAVGSSGSVRADDVISKLKDDGDFDRLRIKIVRKLKENEELRGNIMSMVKQSAALNRTGAENMKPRQLSDAIHQEIGDKLMSQISDGVWDIIRCADGMKAEITETVQSVYDKLANPHGKENGESSSHKGSLSAPNELDNNGDATGAIETDATPLDGEPNVPPGFGSTGVHRRNKNHQTNQPNNNGQAIDNSGYDAPPGFSSALKRKHRGDASDEDPDVPPGFG